MCIPNIFGSFGHRRSKEKKGNSSTGDIGLQEIYYNLPGTQRTEVNEEKSEYEIAIEELDGYFAQKQSKIYERHIFSNEARSRRKI